MIYTTQYRVYMHKGTSIIENFLGFFNVFQTLNFYDAILALIEISIIAFVIYHIFMWIKNTRIYALLRGIIVIAVFVLIAEFFDFKVILWIIKSLAVVSLMSLIIVFQNDIRTGLEHLGRSSVLSKLIPNIGKFYKKTSDNIVDEIVQASFVMGKERTGALIVIEQKESLEEIEHTGILIDGKVSKQLLINIFEKNTPLHDGAVLIVGDIIKAATCYLPLSHSRNISKDLGTRHRAALGVSEMSDSLTLVVSEESGNVSVCYRGEMNTVSDERELTAILKENIYSDSKKEKKSIVSSMKGWFSNE